MRTLPELAQQALDVQDACNLSGGVQAWSQAITNLRELMPTAGTEALNRHPINKLWADKVSGLAGIGYANPVDYVNEAYAVVSEMAASKSGPVNPCNCGDVNCTAQPGHCGAYKVGAEPLMGRTWADNPYSKVYTDEDLGLGKPDGEPLED